MAKSPTPIPAPPVKIQRDTNGAAPAAPATKPKKAASQKRRKRRRNPLLWFLHALIRRIYFGLKTASRLVLLRDGAEEHIDLTENDLVFLTPGGCVENSALGSQDSPAPFRPELKPGGGWDMWRRIAARDPAFGRPDKFCSQPELSNWMSATVTTLDDKIPPYVQRICQRDPFSGKVVTGGIVTVKDSAWMMSYTFNRQPHFKAQPEGQLVGWIYGLFTDVPGDYVKKPMRACTGREIGLWRPSWPGR